MNIIVTTNLRIQRICVTMDICAD